MIIDYHYRGQIEVGTGKGYKWVDGYSETTPSGGVLYPWIPRKECIQDAKVQGARASFKR